MYYQFYVSSIFFLLFPDLIVIWMLNLREYGKLRKEA